MKKENETEIAVPPVLDQSGPPIPPVLELATRPSDFAAASVRPANASAARSSGIWRFIVALWKFFLGVALCQSLLLSVLVVGWTQRLMQRLVYKRWWKQSPVRRSGTSFDAFLATSPELAQHVHWPNWIVRQNFRAASRGRSFKSFFHSLWLNAKLGVQGIINTWVLTMPACVAMLFAWGYGWNNSFNKGYEHAAIGPGIGLLGVALFITAMLYVPMAQAHQATTGNWRAFYQWRIVWRVIRCRWLATLLLAALYSAVSIPIFVQRALPTFLGQMSKASTAELMSLTPAQIEQRLNLYFLGAAITVLIGFVLVRWVAARIYAGGILRALRRGDIPAYALAEEQHGALERLGYLALPPEPPRHVVLDVAGRFVSLALRSGGAFAAVFLWFTFVAQIYIERFFNYIPLLGWLNQPLVQLPWIRYVPHKINGELGFALAVAALVLAAFGVKSAVKQLRPRKVSLLQQPPPI